MRSRAQSDKTGGENLDRELPRDKKESENDQLKAVGVAECLQGNKRKTCRRSQSQKRVQLSSVWKQQISSWDPGAAANAQVRKRLGTGQKPQTSRPSMWHTATDAPGGLKRQDRGGPRGRRKATSWQQGKLRETEKKAGSSSSRHRGAHTDAQKHVWQSRQRSMKPRLRRNCTAWLKTKSAARVKTAFTNFSFDK